MKKKKNFDCYSLFPNPVYQKCCHNNAGDRNHRMMFSKREINQGKR